MMKTQHPLEKGQILVLFVFGLIGLLAFTALAIDGGMVFTDRRYDQSVADAAALAGAQAAEKVLNQEGVFYEDFTCNPSDPKYIPIFNAMTEAYNAAVDRANANLPVSETFSDVFDADLSDQMGVTILCQPAAPTGNPLEERFLDVHVEVASETRTSFAHLLFGRERVRNQVTSVVRLESAVPLAYGNAIVSLNQNVPCNGAAALGMALNGGGSNDASVIIDGGGMYSNSCITRNGHFSVEVTDGSVLHYAPLPDGYDDNGSGSISPSPEQAPNPIVIEDSWDPACGSNKTIADAVDNGTAKVLPPGTYPSGISITNGDWIFEEGLYCLQGNLKINGGNVIGGCTTTEYTTGVGGPTEDCDSGGVTFVMKSGEVNIMGGAVVKLYAPLSEEADPEIKGMLFYMPESNSSRIDITGTSASEFRGTILAPTSDVTLNGTNHTSAEFAVQVIGWNVTIGGNDEVNIIYDTENTVVFPASADQHK
ncbi:MAG TPA: pilus assembly protein TadG-related protein [Anaerolineaceae bacterium]|nr:pilus assembly protein TadG-related protein [Anaerolineaceae bacterium]